MRRGADALYRFNTEVFIAALWRQVDGVCNCHRSIEVVPEEVLSWDRHIQSVSHRKVIGNPTKRQTIYWEKTNVN